MSRFHFLWLVTALTLFPLSLSFGEEPWIIHPTGTKERLRGLSAVNRDIAWASGTKGTWLRTTDGGTSWKSGVVPGASNLDFRDLHAVDARSAYLLSSGVGELSRIYKTVDGGLSWNLQITNPDPKGFWDALAFWDSEHGLAFGDPVDGKFVLLTTSDGGKTWARLPSDKLPAALEGEGAFAASGTCLNVGKGGRVAFATGGAKVARVFQSGDFGKTWTVQPTPIHAGVASAGIFSIAFGDDGHGVIVGGDYKNPTDVTGTVAVSSDSGTNWDDVKTKPLAGYRSAVAYRDANVLIAVGPTGSDTSRDGGRTWDRTGMTGFDSLAVTKDGAVWASGEDGRVARWR